MELLRALNLFPAVGIMLFGVTLWRLLGIDAWHWAPYWLCGGLVVYNADRLRHDSADLHNNPARYQRQARYRLASTALAAGAGLALLLLPIAERDWAALAMVLGGSLGSLSYTFPLLGRRIKELPIFKSFFPPLAIAGAYMLLPLPAESPRLAWGHWWLLSAWALLVLSANVILCDLRDITGDRAAGVVTVPVACGIARTRQLLWAMLGLAALAAWPLLHHLPGPTWAIPATTFYLAIVLAAQPRWGHHDTFYELGADGFLFLAAALALLPWW